MATATREKEAASAAPLKFESVTIENYRCLASLAIPSCARVNLITGRNNVGKTSVLEALYFAGGGLNQYTIPKVLAARESPAILPDGRLDLNVLKREVRQFPSRQRIGAGEVLVSWGRSGQARLDVESALQTITANHSISGVRESNLLVEDDPGATTRFLPSRGASRLQCAMLWDQVQLTPREDDVRDALQIIEPRVRRIGMTGDGIYRETIVLLEDEIAPLPLTTLGEGMNRLVGIALGLVNSKEGVLLIDEFESGLHYTIQRDIWRMVFQVARRLQVQVFATTHSWDCIGAFTQAALESDGEDGQLIRLARQGGQVVATCFAEEELDVVTRSQIEVR